MRKTVPIVDLFSGPGGLSEGFAAFKSPLNRRRYKTLLSIEMEQSAYRTLQLREFLRNFASGFPEDYYAFVNGITPHEPDWSKLYPRAWTDAQAKTLCVEMGTKSGDEIVRRRIARLREQYGSRILLLGGPPCQSYSIIGRSRNVANMDYNPKKDTRLMLYKQYAQVLGQLRPVMAVLENVNGLVTAKMNDKPIFPALLRSLRNAGKPKSYSLFALSTGTEVTRIDQELVSREFLVKAED